MNDRSPLTDRDRALLNDIPSDQLSIDRVRDRILSAAARPAPRRPLIPAAWAMAALVLGISPFAYRLATERPQSVATRSVPASAPPAVESAEVITAVAMNASKPAPVVKFVPVPVPTVAPAPPTREIVVARPARRLRTRRPHSSPRIVVPPVVAETVADAAPADKGPVEKKQMAAPKDSVSPSLVASRRVPAPLPEETVVVMEDPLRPGGPTVAIEQEATAALDIGG